MACKKGDYLVQAEKNILRCARLRPLQIKLITRHHCTKAATLAGVGRNLGYFLRIGARFAIAGPATFIAAAPTARGPRTTRPGRPLAGLAEVTATSASTSSVSASDATRGQGQLSDRLNSSLGAGCVSTAASVGVVGSLRSTQLERRKSRLKRTLQGVAKLR